jgi:hypothetical protein
LLALLIRRTVANRCTKNGAPPMAPPPTLAMFRVPHLTATALHPSSTASSVGATDASSQQRSRLRWAIREVQGFRDP